MEVLVFQGVVAISLVAVRMIKPSILLHTAAGWSIFTLFMVFMPWLMGLQLMVIWGAYALLKETHTDVENVAPKAPVEKSIPDAPATRESDKSYGGRRALELVPQEHMARAVEPEEDASATDMAGRGVNNSVVKTAVKRLDALSDLVAEGSRMAREIRVLDEATKELERRCANERKLVEDCLSIANTKLELEQDPELREIFEEVRSSMPKIEAKVGRWDEEHQTVKSDVRAYENDEDVLPLKKYPEFSYIIRKKAQGIIERHDNFLKEVTTQIRSDLRLKELFQAEMRQRGAFKRISKKTSEGTIDKRLLLETQEPTEKSLLGGRVYEIMRSAAIGRIRTARQIPYLVHFTNSRNLMSINCHGLISCDALTSQSLSSMRNDRDRWDGRTDAVCLSVAFPNVDLFWKYRKRHPEDDWCILIIDASILSSKGCAFCSENAASRAMRRIPTKLLRHPYFFEQMFSDNLEGVTRNSDLPSYFPTKEQAEVLVFDTIPVEAISKVAFESQTAADRHVSFPHRWDIIIQPNETGFFSRRRTIAAPELDNLPH